MSFRETKWSCSECGYSMDAASAPGHENAVPAAGDVSMCLNCGHLYIRRESSWDEPSVDEYLAMPADVKQTIETLRQLRKKVVTTNLKTGGKNGRDG